MATYTKRIMQAGGSLFVPVPRTVVELWGLERGTEVHLELTQNELRITPQTHVQGRPVSQADLDRFWEAMAGVEATASVEDDGTAVRVEFASADPAVARSLVQQVRRALPGVLAMLGVRESQAPPS